MPPEPGANGAAAGPPAESAAAAGGRPDAANANALSLRAAAALKKGMETPPDVVQEPIAGLRKAAILMMGLNDELATLLLQNLGDAEAQKVTEEITHMGDVSSNDVRRVLAEFHALLEADEYVLRGGPDYALRLLTEAFGEVRAAGMLAQVQAGSDNNVGDLATLQKLEPQQLSKFLENEHPQTVALVLAHLDARKGSMLLMHLTPAMRTEAIQRLAEVRQFSPEMAQKVALVLARRMDSLGQTGRKNYAGYKSVAELLNRIDAGTTKGILEAIEQKAPKIAIEIRALMFTFDDLLTVPQASIRELVGAADKKMLAMALKGGKESVRAHMYKAMSSRASEMLKEDMESLGPVRAKDVSAAQQELLLLANKLESEGKMVLSVETDNDLSV
jgi:flagellar motor switch protein FliG